MPIRQTSNRSSYDSGFYNPEVYSNVGSRVVGYDFDALVYINAVEAADGQALEGSVKDAYNTFVVGCKSDGIWNAIKASCIMAGARTLSGALVPLVGVAPSGFNLASGTYSRVNGLKGDGAAMYLNSNRLSSADPQDNRHIAVFVTTGDTLASVGTYIAGGASGYAGILRSPSVNALVSYVSNDSQNLIIPSQGNTVGFKGVVRSSATTISGRSGGVVAFSGGIPSRADTSSRTISVFAQTYTSVNLYSNSRMTYYSIGEYLDLNKLDARVSGLMVAISGAIA
jgi:hypothetical protein